MLLFLDWFFHAAHITVIIINTTFWMSRRTLRIAQISLALTFISWVGFGFWYGFGYCFLTDWHWQLKESIGQTDLPYSYIKYILDHATGSDWNPQLVDTITGVTLGISLVGCLIQSYRKAKFDTASSLG